MEHFENKHVINFKIEKEPKMKYYDFEAFPKIVEMLSRDKIIFHVLFGAFYGTSCSSTVYQRLEDLPKLAFL